MGDIENKGEVLLTEEQVWDVMTFARSLGQDLSWLKGGGIYTPQILNSNLLGLNNNSKIPKSYDEVIKVLSNSVDNIDTINSFCQYMSWFDTTFNKILEYKSGLLSYDLAWNCTNAYTKKDYKSKEFKEDLMRVRKFLDNFDYKRWFSVVTKNLLLNGKYFCWLRESKGKKDGSPKYALQMLPQQYCKITGYTETTPLFDVNLSFLLSGTVDIDLYADAFGKYYGELFNSESQKNYRPSNSFDERTGSWAYWVQTSPKDGGYAFLFDESNFAGISPMSTLLRDTILGAELQKLQYNKDIAAAQAILAGEIKMNDNSKQSNDFSIDPELLGKLLSLVQSGLSDMFKIAAMPTENTKFHQYEDKNKDMYSKTLSNVAGLGASASSLIYSEGKSSQFEIENQITNDSKPLIKIYEQFSTFLNYFINQKTRKYKFNFEFVGIDYEFDQIRRRENLEFLVDRGLVPNLTYFAQALGYPPHSFMAAVEEGAWGDLSDKLGELKSIHTASAGDGLKSKGRPRQKRVKTENRDYDNS